MLNIPGAGLLGMALRLIQPQRVNWYQFTGRTLDTDRKYINSYADAAPIDLCSVQAVPLSRYDMLGLDRKRKYITWFVPAAAVGTDRDRSSDEFGWNNRRYSIVTETPWNVQDGWMEILGIDVGAEGP